MSDIINARIPPAVRQKLAEYCVKQGVSRSEVVVRALDQFLDAAAGGANPGTLAAGLIPENGIAEIQSGNVRELAQMAFRDRRAR